MAYKKLPLPFAALRFELAHSTCYIANKWLAGNEVNCRAGIEREVDRQAVRAPGLHRGHYL